MLKRNNKYCVKCKEKKLKTIKEFDRIMGNMGGSKAKRQSGNKEWWHYCKHISID